MRGDIWVFLFSLGLALFSWPVLSIFKAGLTGYLFFIWALFIVLLFITASFSGGEDKGN